MNLPPSADGTNALRAALSRAWRPRSTESVSEVAGRHLYLSPEYAAAPGYVDFGRYPYLKEPTDRLGPDDPCRTVVFLGPVQSGKSVIGMAWFTYIVTTTPGPTLWVTDTDGKAESFSKKRLDLMIRDDPTIHTLVADQSSRNRDNTIKYKKFVGGDIKLVGAQSASGLTSDTIKYAVIDEADDHKDNVSYAGSSIDLAMNRQTAFGNLAKTLIISSPKIKDDSDIEKWFLKGNQSLLWVPCPHCGEFQKLEWRDPETGEYRLKWSKGHPDEAVYICKFCGVGIEDHEKNIMLPRGEWRPERPEVEDVASYRLNALYLPVGSYSWKDMASQWEAATFDLKAGSTERHRTFINTRLAESYEIPGETLDAHALARLVEPSWGDEIPAGVRAIVIGGDIQNDRAELMVAGVGNGREWWLLDYFVVQSDPLDDQTWRQVDDVLLRTYTREDGTTLRVRATCLDSGYRTQKVYEFCNRRTKRGVYATKGEPGRSKPIWTPKARNSSRYKKRLYQFWTVGVDTAKDTAQQYLRVHVPGPGYVHIPQHVIDRVPTLLDQLASEKRTKTKDSKGREQWSWEKLTSDTRNEAWDCFVLCIAASHKLTTGGLDLRAPVTSTDPPTTSTTTATPAPQPARPTATPAPTGRSADPARHPPRREPPRRSGNDWFSGGRPGRMGWG